MNTKKIICPCCEKEVEIPLLKYSTGFDFNYTILLNSEKEFFELVELCPSCGYAMVFDNDVDDEIRAYIQSEQYQNLLKDEMIDEGLKRWILAAFIAEFDENYTEAGIDYTKAFDYMELKGMELDYRLIEKAASCFLAAVTETDSLPDAILAADSMRRDGEFGAASEFIDMIYDTFEGELVDHVVRKEKIWVDLKEKSKKYIDL